MGKPHQPTIKVTRGNNQEKKIQFLAFLIELALEQERKEATLNEPTPTSV